MRTALLALVTGGAMLGGCAAHDDRPVGRPVSQAEMAVARIYGSNGRDLGRATARTVAGGLRFTLDVHGLPPGLHGTHVHTTGRCDAPDFTSAGGHWNPTDRQHGSRNPQGPHMGDLPNLIVGADGQGTLAANVPGATMAGLLDADGAAIVIHAGPDDLMTDPSGDSGARIGCGVFARN